MRRVYQASYITDDGRLFTADGIEIDSFMVQEMEEIQTLADGWVYRLPLDDNDDPRVFVKKLPDGTYRSISTSD